MMTSEMTPLLWRELSKDEEIEFREYARKHYVIGNNIDLLAHPVYVHECYIMNRNAGILKSG